MDSDATMSDGAQSLRIAFTVVHLMLVGIGFLNIIIISMIVSKTYLRSITNVYMLGLCLADFIYLFDLIFVAATSLNGKSWPFGSVMCSVYHGTETTAKYASVLFITLLAADRYFAICKSDVARGYRSYPTAIALSLAAWVIAIFFSLPLYGYAEQKSFRYKPRNGTDVDETEHIMCIVHWKNPHISTWYIGVCSLCIYMIPGLTVFWCYYQVFCKLREHIKGSRRLRQNSARYRKVTQMVQRVVLFHLLCWTPFWMFNLFSTLYRMRITSLFERIVINIIHLFPYINCAVNPILYAHGAENFRTAFREIFLCQSRERQIEPLPPNNTRSTCYRNSSNVPNIETANRSLLMPAQEALSVYTPEDDIKTENSCSEEKETDSMLAVRYTQMRPVLIGVTDCITTIREERHRSKSTASQDQ